MTLPSKNSRRVVTNTGSVTAIDVDFPADQPQYVKVYAGLPGRYEMVLGVDYTLTGVAAGSEDFTVNIIDPAGWDDYGLFAVSVEYAVEQPSDVDVGGPFGLRFENALDRLALIMQSLEDRVNRAVKMPVTGPVGPGNELTPFPDQLIGWNADGTALETKPQISQSVQEAIDSAEAAAASALAAAGIVDAFELNVAGYTITFNNNAADKTTAFDANATAKTVAFDVNAAAALEAFNDTVEAAQDYSIIAGKWAEEAEDVEVEPGKFSALHWAAKAEQVVLDGLVDLSVTTQKIANSAVTNDKLANMAQATIKGRASGAGTGAPTDLSVSDLFAILGSVFPARPQLAAGVGQIVTWSTPVGGGYSVPNGGTWFAIWTGYLQSNASWAAGLSGTVVAGGSVVQPGFAGIIFTGIAWRIA